MTYQEAMNKLEKIFKDGDISIQYFLYSVDIREDRCIINKILSADQVFNAVNTWYFFSSNFNQSKYVDFIEEFNEDLLLYKIDDKYSIL